MAGQTVNKPSKNIGRWVFASSGMVVAIQNGQGQSEKKEKKPAENRDPFPETLRCTECKTKKLQQQKAKTMANTIVSTILNQLGGGPKLKAMINARDLVRTGDNKIAFKFSGCRKANYCSITLDLASDTYSVELLKIGRLNKRTWELPKTVTHKEFAGIYGDQLKGLFERHTGLLLSL